MGEWRGPARFICSDAAGVGDRYRSGIEEGGGEKHGESNGVNHCGHVAIRFSNHASVNEE